MYICKLRTSPQILSVQGQQLQLVGVGVRSMVCLYVCWITVCFVGMQMVQRGMCECLCLLRQVLVSVDIFATPQGILVEFHFIVALCQPYGDGCNLCFTSGYAGNYFSYIQLLLHCWYCCCCPDGSSLHAYNMQFGGVVAAYCCLPAAQVSPIIMALSKYA